MTARKSPRGSPRSNTNRGITDQRVVALMSPSRVLRLPVPPPVTDTITITKRIQIGMTQTGTTPQNLYVNELMAGVPGGLTYWTRVRIERIDVWSDYKNVTGATSSVNTDTLTVAIPPDSEWDQPNREWTDTGVPGQRRAHVGFRLGLLDRARYFITAADQILCQIGMDTEDASVIVQATLELTSPLLS